ncbi:hypothetical protein PI125_g4284 [Phytophthora idaei]|nr:hypothetical protein PI125_g4284 [Phytophthora idaei]
MEQDPTMDKTRKRSSVQKPDMQKRRRPGNGPPRMDLSNFQFLLGGAVGALGLERER